MVYPVKKEEKVQKVIG